MYDQSKLHEWRGRSLSRRLQRQDEIHAPELKEPHAFVRVRAWRKSAGRGREARSGSVRAPGQLKERQHTPPKMRVTQAESCRARQKIEMPVRDGAMN